MRHISAWSTRRRCAGRTARISSASPRSRFAISWSTTPEATKRPNAEPGAAKLSLDEAIGVPDRQEVDVLALDESLERLANLDPQQGQIVELRFFGGLSIEETAEVLHISPATVKRDWVMAKAWLYQNLARFNLIPTRRFARLLESSSKNLAFMTVR